MRLRPLLFLFLVWSSSSCGLREREKELEAKMSEVNQKEQQLLLKERTLELKEAELRKMEQEIDSSAKMNIAKDSAFIYNPAIVGNWTVTMTCTETNCSGSAVGDTKTEQWEIAYQDDALVARAKVGKELVRVYTGRYFGNTIQLTAQQEESAQKLTRMVVRIQEIRKDEMEGRREIIRPEDCRIIYSISLKKLN